MRSKMSTRVVAALLGAATLWLSGCLFGPFSPPANTTGASSASQTRGLNQVALRQVSPLNSQDVFPDFVQLAWTAVPGATSYDVYLGLDGTAPLVANVKDTTYQARDLLPCTAHFWRIVAMNDNGDFVSGPFWSFKTRCP